MAKIRVGDIEIDGAQITIGGQPITNPNRPVAAPPQPTTQALIPHPSTNTNLLQPRNDLAKLPGQPISWAAAGLGLFTFAVVVGIPYFVYLGVGITVLGVLKNRAHREEARYLRLLEEQKQLQLEATFAPTREKLRRLLGEVSEPLTVEQIAQRVRLSQTELLRGLAMLRDQGEVTEDLNIESGDWVYSLAKKQLPPQDLDARIAALEALEVNTRNR